MTDTSQCAMSKRIMSAVFASACILVAGCGGDKAARQPKGGIVQSDSVKEAGIVIAAFPDTLFSSAVAVKFNIELNDTSVSPEVSVLEDIYESVPGVFTFRKGSRRDASFGGKVDSVPTRVEVDWTFITPSDNRPTKFGVWGGGTGWTGQPLYVEWPDSCVDRFKSGGGLTDDFSRREIIVGSLSSNILFINFDSGKASRRPIPTGNPVKGTVSLDPSLNGNLYVGQGVPAERPFGALTIDLYSHRVSDIFPEDPKAPRGWNAYDSSPVRAGRFLFRPGENGTLYKFIIEPGQLRLHSSMHYRVNGAAPGMEASMSVCRNYGYTADNHGNVICVNLNTLKPVWRYDLGDDADSSPVVVEENGHPYVYTGCEIDRKGSGNASFVKLDGLTGELLWEAKVPGRRREDGEKHFDGGFYSTSLPGTGDCSDLIFVNTVTNDGGASGDFVAFDRAGGRIIYRTKLKYYAWSSPVGFLTPSGKMTIFTADCAGNVYLIAPRTGEIIFSRHVGNNFESSPVVVGNSLVIGSRGNKIYKMTLK